jgi:8-amino-7-oxononanoate synthase
MEKGIYSFLEKELMSIRQKDLLRILRPIEATGGKFVFNGCEVLNFSSNDYLNLAGDTRLKQAAVNAVKKWGTGATASRLMCGNLSLYQELEAELAQMTGKEEALVFGSGFLTNVGIISSLASKEDVIFADKLNHASLIDGMLLSRARWHRYRHRDMNHLEDLLKKTDGAGRGRRFIVTDSIFSMDGDLAPLVELALLADKYGAMLIVDEAHAIGLRGKDGGGVCRELGITDRADIIIGTMSKALGSYGGFAAFSGRIKSYFVNKARTLIYSTGLPPATLASALEAARLIKKHDRMGPSGAMESLGKKLFSRVKYFHALLAAGGFPLPPLESQILPFPVGKNNGALNLAERLQERNLLAVAIRPPTVPEGTARLRLSVTLAHTERDLKKAAGYIIQCAKGEGVL